MGMGNPHGFRFSLVHLHKTLRMSNSCYSSLMEVRRGHSKPLGLVDGGQVQRVKGDHGTHCKQQRRQQQPGPCARTSTPLRGRAQASTNILPRFWLLLMPYCLATSMPIFLYVYTSPRSLFSVPKSHLYRASNCEITPLLASLFSKPLFVISQVLYLYFKQINIILD